MCRNWLVAKKAEQVKGKPLTCIACKGVLLLNGESLKQHINSKKHLKQLKLLKDVDPIAFAGEPKQDNAGADVWFCIAG